MSAALIHVDFKNRKKVKAQSRDEKQPAQSGIDIARNKQIINDLKAVLDEAVDKVDLQTGIILIPESSEDFYLKLDSANQQTTPSDVNGIGRMYHKMRQAHAQP
jgi:hypothetical protein